MAQTNWYVYMIRRIPIDPDSDIVEEHFAVVFAPQRKRGRFPEASVELVASEAEARRGADPETNRYAAKLVGPSRSSEGLRLYYLEAWLD